MNRMDFYYPPDCGKSNHLPVKVKRGKKPDFVYCSVCKRKLKLIKKTKKMEVGGNEQIYS
jgi:hypothetical protein